MRRRLTVNVDRLQPFFARAGTPPTSGPVPAVSDPEQDPPRTFRAGGATAAGFSHVVRYGRAYALGLAETRASLLDAASH